MRLGRINRFVPQHFTGSMARHSSASLALKLFGLGSGFLFAMATARLLGPSGYGIVAVALSTATVVATFSLLGTDGLAVRETAALVTRERWNELRQFLRWTCLTALIASVLSSLLVAAVSLLPGPYGKALLLSSAAVPLYAGMTLLRSILQGAGNVVGAQVPGEVVRWVVTLALMAILLLHNVASPPAVIAVVLTALTVAVLTGAAVLFRLLARLPEGSRADDDARSWMSQSAPFLALALFGIVGTEINTLLLGWLAGPREAGLYQPIAKLAPLMLVGSAAIEMALAPRIVRMWEQDDTGGLQRTLARSAVASTLVTATITGAILAASPWILGAFGEEFTRYRSYLFWIAAAQVVNAALGASPLLLAMVGSMRQRLQAQTVTLIVQAGLAILLVPKMGAAGAVISLTAAILAWATLHWYLAWRATRIDTSSFGIFRRLGRTTL